ncbi:MAG: hypothetical protein ABSE39_08300 [Candidatus Bathyarchaeia archaeon]|jgi:hypothetical protein
MTESDLLEKMGILIDIRSYLRILAASSLSHRAKNVIDSYKRAEVFRALDGNTSDEKIRAMTNVPTRTVTSWVEEFVRQGLAEKVGRLEKALFTLEELDVDISSLKREKSNIKRSEKNE